MIIMHMRMQKGLLLTVRQFRDVCRGANLAVGRHWQRFMLKRHFDPDARSRYHYQVRTEKYMKAKKNSGHGTVDLVYSGRSREYLQSTSAVRAFPTRVTITMIGPQYFRPMPGVGKKKMPDLQAELLAVTDDEREELIRVFEESYKQLYEAAQNEFLGSMASSYKHAY